MVMEKVSRVCDAKKLNENSLSCNKVKIRNQEEMRAQR